MIPIAIYILLLLFPGFNLLKSYGKQNCGVERWAVKTLTDKDTSFINFNPCVTTVAAQAGLESVSPSSLAPRRADERQVFCLMAFIISLKLETDGDYHLILKDLKGEQTMIAEIPDPECPSLIGNRHARQYRAARAWVIAHLGRPLSSQRFVRPPVLATLIGVGYFDPYHGQTGAAPSNRELHPVISIK